MPDIDPESYREQLAEKEKRVRELFCHHCLPEIELFPSPPLHFRMRAEFRIWHQGERSFYAMTPVGDHRPRPITDFPIGSKQMLDAMHPLLAEINAQSTLRHKLYAVEFLTTLSGQVLVTLIYHRRLDADWQQTAQILSSKLNIGIIGRSKKQKIVLDRDYVVETLSVDDETYYYQQVETGFTQPNARVNEKMLAWAKRVSRGLNDDLLELYCGNGNFTMVLSENFNRVLATELAKISVRSALFNLQLNNVANVQIVRMSSEEFTAALNGARSFNRLKEIDLSSYRFSTIFVDPPRAGLDSETIKLASRFDNILYISCNPQTLRENLDKLSATHRVTHFALFDQFPYTPHVECGALLKSLKGIPALIKPVGYPPETGH